MLSASTLKPSSLAISKRRWGWSRLGGICSSPSEGGISSSEQDSIPKNKENLLTFHSLIHWKTLKWSKWNKIERQNIFPFKLHYTWVFVPVRCTTVNRIPSCWLVAVSTSRQWKAIPRSRPNIKSMKGHKLMD